MQQEQERINVDEEKRLITIKNYLQKIDVIQIYDEELIGKRNELVSVLKNLITPLGMNIVSLKKSEVEIESVLGNELTLDLYESDPVFKDVKYYIENSKTGIHLQEKFIQILSQFILDFLVISNDKTPISSASNSNIDDGTPTLSEEEREKLKRTAYTLILNYKQQTTPARKKVIASRLLYFADTKEKYKIINDLFLDLVGEKVLDTIKKKQAKKVINNSAGKRDSQRGE